MSSYKSHSIFALILGLLFSFNPLIIALTIIGANIPDFDHKFKKDHVYKMMILGLFVFISLYILNLPYFLGLIIIFIAITFYFSEHRSFTHSIFGIITLTAAASLILIWAFELIVSVYIIPNDYLMAILIVLLSFLFLNKRVLSVFIPLFFVCVIFFQVFEITYLEIAFGLFLGFFSHIILDASTPAGIKLFAPLSQKKVYKNFSIAATFILIIVAILYRSPFLFSLFETYVL